MNISVESLRIGPDIYKTFKNRPRYLWKDEESAQTFIKRFKIGPDMYRKF